MTVAAPRERSLVTVRRAMEPVWRSARLRAMPGRPEFLLARDVGLECLTPTPKNVAGRPARANQMGCVLRSPERREAKGALFFSADFSAPWGVRDAGIQGARLGAVPGAPHLVVYHLVIDGVARATLPGGGSLPLGPGDVVVFPHGDSHELSSASGAQHMDKAALLQKIASRDLTPMHSGGGGEDTRFACGYMALDPLLSAPILEGLPSMFKVNVRTDRCGALAGRLVVAPRRRGGVASRRQRRDAGQGVRSAVRRYASPVCGGTAGASDRLAGRSTRSHRQQKSRAVACPRRPCVDDRRAGRGGRRLTNRALSTDSPNICQSRRWRI